MKATGTTLGLLGLWLIVAGIWRFGLMAEMWNNLIVGLIVAVAGFSVANTRRRTPMTTNRRGAGVFSGILGLWLIVSAFIPGLTVGAALLVNNLIVGLLLAISGVTIAASGPTREEETGARRAA